jgi:predicted acyl esterase
MDGCMLTDNFNWSCQMFAYLSRPADPLLRDDWREDWIKRIEEVPFMAADWMRHPNRDEFWKHGSVCEDWSKIQIPVLAITGWADSYINTPPALAKNLSSPTKAIIGPWEHRYAHISKIDPADFHSEVIGWFDRWLKGEQNGAEDLPDYRTFMQEHSNPSPKNTPRKGRWIAEHKWPSPNMTQKNLYLCPGSLTDTMVAGNQVITTPAHVGTQAGYYCPGMRIDNELAGDQTNDDEMSVCFDTLPLSKPMELMGRCSLKISFTVDKPVAQICARLCDVSSDNISQRLSYRCFNLNHQDSHETPAMLMPEQEYQAIIELNECAHRLRKGHKLRLALSTSYWPIIWPSPEAASVTINLEKSSFSIPVRNVTDEIDPAAPGKPQDFPALQAEELRAASGTSQSGMQDDGRYLLETFDDYGKTRDPYHRMIVGSHVHQHYSIHPDAPETARQETKWNFTFERNEWSVEINTESVMTCDENNFHLTRKLRAYEGVNKSEVLTKDWSETIPRGLL